MATVDVEAEVNPSHHRGLEDAQLETAARHLDRPRPSTDQARGHLAALQVCCPGSGDSQVGHTTPAIVDQARARRNCSHLEHRPHPIGRHQPTPRSRDRTGRIVGHDDETDLIAGRQQAGHLTVEVEECRRGATEQPPPPRSGVGIDGHHPGRHGQRPRRNPWPRRGPSPEVGQRSGEAREIAESR